MNHCARQEQVMVQESQQWQAGLLREAEYSPARFWRLQDRLLAWQIAAWLGWLGFFALFFLSH